MSSSRRGGKLFVADTANSSSMGKGISEHSSPKTDQLSHSVEDIGLDSAQDGGWEVYSRKSRNRSRSHASKSLTPYNTNPKTCGQPDVSQKFGKQNSGWEKGLGPSRSTPSVDSRRNATGGNFRHQSSTSNLTAAQSVIPPPLQQGWNWKARSAAFHPLEDGAGEEHHLQNFFSDIEGGSDVVDDIDDELLTDEFDSDASEKSHETCKTSKWFKTFFAILDKLTVEQINEPAREWHCPACQGGPGAIDWYRGLQPLMTHAMMKRSMRVKVHQKFAQLLDEELSRRGTFLSPIVESFGKWKGLNEIVTDRKIIWPPMVVITNSKHERDDMDKWIGMGNQELLDYFSSYDAVKARHSYGPQGHRGMSVLIFESSAMGFLEAERLHNHFKDQGTDREAWERNPVLFCHGGMRQLYGFMAEKRDLDIFNEHSKGKSKLKFEMRSYQEMVVIPLRQVSEDNQQLIWFKKKVAKEQRHSKALQESFSLVSEKLRKSLEENRIVRQRSKMHHEQNKEEMDFQEQFFKDQLKMIREARDAKEDNFEKIQQEEREKVKQLSTGSSSAEGRRQRWDQIAMFIKLQDEEMEEFAAQKEKLIEAHEEEMIAMKRRYWEEEVELEKKLNAELNRLMEKYAPC